MAKVHYVILCDKSQIRIGSMPHNFTLVPLNCKLKRILEEKELSGKDCRDVRYLVFLLYSNQIVSTGDLF